MRELSGQERAKLEAAIMAAFPDPDELEMLLLHRLDIHMPQIVPMSRAYQVIVFRLLEKSEGHGWTADLIAAACSERPGNSSLAEVAEALRLVPVVPDRLERLISDRAGFQDIAAWRAELWRAESRVCRIEAPVGGLTQSRGTGFLVAADLVLTNHHVVAHMIERGEDKGTRLRFDHKLADDGTTVSDGVVHDLADDWLVCSSPPGAAETSAAATLPRPDELDYALLRLDAAVGAEPAGPAADPGALAPRGWVDLDAAAGEPQAQDLAIIVQHPDNRPLQLAIDTVLDLNDNGTRVRYRTNTASGSSGAPCFSIDWRLSALHQAGGHPDAEHPHNQGIPISAIMRHLQSKGLLT